MKEISKLCKDYMIKLCEQHPDPSQNTLDHFFVKLLKLQDKLHTQSAKVEGAKRAQTMQLLLDALKRELNSCRL
jgi:uncharacterized protein